MSLPTVPRGNIQRLRRLRLFSSMMQDLRVMDFLDCTMFA